MDEIITIAQRVQGALTWLGEIDLHLPHIAVVGAQSVGKSSVLEALVGRSFLPKGIGIVTQRPLILQLRNDPNGKEYGEFAHCRGKIFENFANIRDEIKKETIRVTGKSKNVSPIPIYLKISSPKVVDLTLIDLPGITKVPIADQSNDIENKIREMILEYISKPNCIILALSAANTDLATSDSLKLAREVDPDGKRTIGVITKCDTLEDGKVSLDALLGRVYKLDKGFVGVVCKGEESDDLSVSLANEQKFFSTHPVYSNLGGKCGIKYLASLLNKILLQYIRDSLPIIKTKIIATIQEKEAELFSLGGMSHLTSENPAECILHYFSKFSQTLKDTIQGKISPKHLTNQLFGGARIYFIFNDSFLKVINNFEPLTGLDDLEIRAAIRNSTGPCPALFVPEIAFENLVKRQIRLLEFPSLQCVDQVYDEMLNLVDSCCIPELTRLVNMRSRILDVIKGFIHSCMEPTKKMIKNFLAVELSYINTNHPDFLRNSAILEAYNGGERMPVKGEKNDRLTSRVDSMRQSHYSNYSDSYTNNNKASYTRAANMPSSSSSSYDDKTKQVARKLWLPDIPKSVVCGNDPSERDVVEAELIKALIDSYFCIVRKSVADFVPKCIMHFMVNKTTECVQQELITTLYKPELFKELMAESQEVINARAKCQSFLTSLKQALVDINNAI